MFTRRNMVWISVIAVFIALDLLAIHLLRICGADMLTIALAEAAMFVLLVYHIRRFRQIERTMREWQAFRQRQSAT